MRRYIPGNPTIVVQNMPGAGQPAGHDYLYNVAPKDGTVFGTVNRCMATDPLIDGAKFDPRQADLVRQLKRDHRLRHVEDLVGQEIRRPVHAGADRRRHGRRDRSLSGDPAQRFGTKIKMVPGYPGTKEGMLAMERGEVAGRCGWSWSSLKSQK